MPAMVGSIAVARITDGRPVAADSASRGDTVARLLVAAIDGDRTAFVAVLAHYDRLLRLIAWQVLRNRDLMDDALQEVALKAWRALPGYRGEAQLGSWLGRLAYNASVDLLRRRPAERPLDMANAAVTPLWADPSSGADPAEAIGVESLLREAFAALPAEQRLTVMLVDREGFDYETAAGVLGVRPGTVASRLNRARRALRAALKESIPAQVKR